MPAQFDRLCSSIEVVEFLDGTFDLHEIGDIYDGGKWSPYRSGKFSGPGRFMNEGDAKKEAEVLWKQKVDYKDGFRVVWTAKVSEG